MAKVTLKKNKVQLLRSRFEKADNERQNWLHIWEKAYKFALPQLSMGGAPDFSINTPGEDLNIHIYDTTLARATNVFSSKIFNGLTPIGQKWVNLEVGDELKRKGGDLKDITVELQAVNDTIFQFINASNFYEEMGSAYENFAIGTMALLVNFNPNNRGRPFIFESVNPQILALEISARNRPENVWRSFDKIKVADIQFKWPTIKLTSKLKQLLRNDPLATTKVIEGTVYQNDKNNFLHVIFGDEENDVLLAEENESTPWIITRFSTRPNEAFGRGRVLTALHAAITLNTMVLFVLQQAQIQLAPPFISTFDSMINPHTFRFGPNKIIPVKSLEALKKLDVAGDLQAARFNMQMLQQQIESIMLTNPMGAINAPAKTATEISGRINETVEELAPTVGRFTAEFYHALFERLLFLSNSEGLISFKTTKGLTIRKNEIQLQYSAPLIRGQDFKDLQAYTQFTRAMQEFFGPQLAPATVNETFIPEYIANLLHFPARLVKSPAELIKVIEAAQQQQQQAQQQQNPSPQQQASGSLLNAFSDAQDIGSTQTPTGV
ncbi:hypothetical protein LCGC14_0995120 [marine sediment metagenome]|uniref:Bacteriophage head to tail connecting protein n=1 Tax=marine sediment metagenome TaxID=412755 RepID=A0A0F9N4P1_9ZZZZ